MIPIIFEKGTTAFNTNGLGRLRDAVSFIVTEERNGIYEADFDYPVDGQNFDLIQCGRIVVCTHDDSGDVQPFDIVSYSKPLNGIVSFHCVHVSYRLNGGVTWSKNVNSLTDALDKLKNQVDGSPFTFSADFTANAYVGAFDSVPKTIKQYLGGVEGSILDTFGGEYEFNGWNVILHRERGEQKDFIIRYGVNLLDYNDDTDYSETFNKAVPYWIGDNGKGVDVVVVGSLADSGEQTYADRTIEAALDFSDRFETKPTAAQLKNEAVWYMNNNRTWQPQQNITVDFVRLQDYADYENLSLLMSCKLCDSIRVIFPKYGVDRFYKIVKTEYNVLNERYNEMELGDLSTSLSDALGIGVDGTFTSNNGPIFYNVSDGDGSVVLGDLAMAWGTSSITSGTSGTTSGGITTYAGSATVDWNSLYGITFQYAPTVSVTFAANYANQVSTSTYSISTTSATVYGRLLTSGSTRTIRWFAIGQLAS